MSRELYMRKNSRMPMKHRIDVKGVLGVADIGTL